MKRTELIKHLMEHGCSLVREGARHSWWQNKELNRRSSVHRHREIDGKLAVKIC